MSRARHHNKFVDIGATFRIEMVNGRSNNMTYESARAVLASRPQCTYRVQICGYADAIDRYTLLLCFVSQIMLN